MSRAHLDIEVTSAGVRSADKDLKQLTRTAKETEAQQRHMADVFAEVALAEEREAQRAVAASAKKAEAAERAAARASAAAAKQAEAAMRAAERENDKWNDAKQKALARYDAQVIAAERAAVRREAATRRSLDRENEMWDRAIQRAKAGLDGVLPARPSLSRIESRLDTLQENSVLSGVKQGALGAVGLGALAGGAAGFAAVGITSLAEKIKHLSGTITENMIADEKLTARLGGLTDSAEQAAAKFEDLRTLTLGKLPSTLSQVGDAFVELGNNGLQNSDRVLKAYSNIAAQTGKSLGQVANAVNLAVLGNYESLRAFGVQIRKEGDNLALTFRGQTETISKNAEAIESYMQRLGSVEFAGAVERQMDTIGGAIKKSDDAWENFVSAIGSSSVGAAVKDSIGTSTEVIETLTSAVESFFGKIDKGLEDLERKQARIRKLAKMEFPGQDVESSERADILGAKFLDARAKLQEEKGGKYEQDYRAYMIRVKNQANAAHEAALQEEQDREKLAEAIGKQSEAEKLLQNIYDDSFTTGDKALKQYNERLAKLDELAAVEGLSFDVEAAKEQAYQNYVREAGGDKRDKQEYAPKIATGERTAYAAYVDMVRKQEYERYLTVRDSLNKQEDAERASYEKRREFLAEYTGPDSEELWARNTALWESHLDELAEKAAKKQIELQRKLQAIGVGPNASVFAAVERKYAGQRFTLDEALEDNLSGKSGEALQLEAQQIYADKSIEIERARAQEIAAINRSLVEQSVVNAELMFGGLSTVMKNAHGEMSAEYRTMFAIQQGFGIAAAEIAMWQSMAEANKQPFPANIPLYFKAAAQGAQIIAQISSLSFSGSYDRGGNVPSGSYGDVGENDWELVRGGKVAGPAQVIGREATAAMLNRGSDASSKFRIINLFDGQEAVSGYLGSTAGEERIVNVLKRNSALIRTLAR